MQRNFILTDVMKTGSHTELEEFVKMNTMYEQKFDMTGEYYTLHNYDLGSYKRRFAIIDTRQINARFKDNAEFHQELKKRCDLLSKKGFVFIKANPWESLQNIKTNPQYPQIQIEHIKWIGGTSWFWFHMYHKHEGKKFNFDHSKKKYDLLYLTKKIRGHRQRMYEAIEPLLANSLYTHWGMGKKLPAEYELPWAQDYPDYGMDQDIYEKPYNHTKYSLVSETHDSNDEIFMTEKIWKAILAEHVFIVHGNLNYIKKLQELGFKTFGDYFDESYDQEIVQKRRIEKIVTTCKTLLQSDWHKIYSETEAIRKHNLDQFWNKNQLGEEINKTLMLFLEFADSR